MENIFNPQTRENLGYYAEKEITPISANKILCYAAGSFLVGKTLKAAGKSSAGSFIGKLVLPLLALGFYRKLTDTSESKLKQNEEENKEQQINQYDSNEL
ncbi:hypothetical protein [Flavobacterium sp. KJJ]|uniref:hypothetical protein n=1 Tax=Flavobacterium sp. KJJ TaxID=1270193 RepID=UPI000493A7B9|nr:hypothetical protein [Flavobacterium sp. KJJ]